MRILSIGDLHLMDHNRGKHEDYARECLFHMHSILVALGEQKFDRIVLLGDFADCVFKDLSFRTGVQCFLNGLREHLVDGGKLYSLRGNHDVLSSGEWTELDFAINTGLLDKCPIVESVGSVSVGYQDYVFRESLDVSVNPLAGYVGCEVLFTHNVYGAEDGNFFGEGFGVGNPALDRLVYVVQGHDHTESYRQFGVGGRNVYVLDGGAACQVSVKYRGIENFGLVVISDEGGALSYSTLRVPYSGTFRDDAKDEVDTDSVVSEVSLECLSVLGGVSCEMNSEGFLEYLNTLSISDGVRAQVRRLVETYANDVGDNVDTDI